MKCRRGKFGNKSEVEEGIKLSGKTVVGRAELLCIRCLRVSDDVTSRHVLRASLVAKVSDRISLILMREVADREVGMRCAHLSIVARIFAVYVGGQ